MTWRGMFMGCLAAVLGLALAGQAPLAPPGPAAVSVLPAEVPTPWTAYGEGGRSRLAVLLTDPDSRWLSISHGLKAIGVPFVLVREPKAALQHRVVLVYPEVPRALAPDLARFVEGGGTLLTVGVLPTALATRLGAGGPAESSRMSLSFTDLGREAFGFDDPRERQLRLGQPGLGALPGSGWKTLDGGAEALAVYEDGTAAIVRRRLGSGTAYAFGMNFGTLLYRGMSGRDEWFARDYVNAFEPAGDVFLRMLRAAYLAGDPAAVVLGTVPEGRAFTFLVTHDIDYARSLGNARAYAEFEQSLGIAATYFLQTKIVRDNEDSAFLNRASVPEVKVLAALGHEVASHSVSHSPVFARFPMGDGAERFPTYRPFVQNATVTRGGTILGELRVSRYLIEALVPEVPVVSFRPGYLANPFTLPEALVAAGYRYASSLTAAGSLTHLPFRQNFGRSGSQELPLWEFPVTVSDEKTSDLMTRLPVARALASRLAKYGGVLVLLIHPSNVEDKLRFERALLPDLKGKAWFGTVGGFGRWWEARDLAGVDVDLDASGATVALTLPEAVTGLVLQVPAAWSAPASVRTLSPGLVAVDAPAGTTTLRFLRSQALTRE